MQAPQYKNKIMQKVFILSGAFILLCFGIYFIYFQNSNDSILKEYNLEPLACSLNKTKCKVLYNNKSVVFNMEPKPIKAMQKTTISILGLDTFLDDIKLHIYGLNMSMGTLIVSMKKQDKIYKGEVILPVCLTEIMRYRIDIYNGLEPLGLSIDFDLQKG